MSVKMKIVSTSIGLVILIATIASAWIWQHHGAYGFNVIFRRGGAYWITIKVDDPRLSPSMRLALVQPQTDLQSGPLVWQDIEKGYV